VDNCRAQRDCILRVQLLAPVLLQASFATLEEDILLATSIDADDGPHAVIVRFELHLGSPAKVEDGQIVCFVNRFNSRVPGLSERSHYLHRFAHGSRHQLPNRSMRVAFFERSAAFFNETFFLKHRHSSFL
jgi:hypothetical protein